MPAKMKSAKRRSKAPSLIASSIASKQLIEGFTVTNPKRQKIKFGKRAINYLKKKRDGESRKRFLLWALDTVKTTSPINLQDRDIYSKVYFENGKDKGFVVLVSIREGEVWDFYRKPAKKL